MPREDASSPLLAPASDAAERADAQVDGSGPLVNPQVGRDEGPFRARRAVEDLENMASTSFLSWEFMLQALNWSILAGFWR